MAETIKPQICQANEQHLPFLSILFGVRGIGFSKARLFSIRFHVLQENKTMHLRHH
jgi:hypothetical protein